MLILENELSEPNQQGWDGTRQSIPSTGWSISESQKGKKDRNSFQSQAFSVRFSSAGSSSRKNSPIHTDSITESSRKGFERKLRLDLRKSGKPHKEGFLALRLDVYAP